MEYLLHALQAIWSRFSDVLLFPLDPANRIYWLYLLTSVIAAYVVYRQIKANGARATAQDAEDASGSFLRFLFPPRVWNHPSAWLDLRYALFHKTVSFFLLLGVAAAGMSKGYWLVTGDPFWDKVDRQGSLLLAGDWAIAIGFLIFATLIADLMAWFLHYLQHKVPLLWQFHKVHHSAEVMHPVSNFREHPVDNLVYSYFISLSYGLAFGGAVAFLGLVPTMPSVLGVPALMFVFNALAYNLRHSHVWLRWPGRWSAILPSPAHHHVHHSCHPDHIDKNFAFMFPMWDLLFGTYIMPDDNRDVRFGVPKEQGRELDSVWRLYWVPFRDAYRLFRRKPAPKPEAQAKPAPNLPAE